MKPITMVVSSGADPPPGEPPGDPGEYQQHQQTIPGASAGLTPEEYDYLYQQKKVYDDDMITNAANTENKAHDNDDNNHKARPYKPIRQIPPIPSTTHDDDNHPQLSNPMITPPPTPQTTTTPKITIGTTPTTKTGTKTTTPMTDDDTPHNPL